MSAGTLTHNNQRTQQESTGREKRTTYGKKISLNFVRAIVVNKVFCLSFSFLPNAFILTCLLTCSLTQHLHILHKQARSHSRAAHTHTTSCLFLFGLIGFCVAHFVPSILIMLYKWIIHAEFPKEKKKLLTRTTSNSDVKNVCRDEIVVLIGFEFLPTGDKRHDK